MTLYYADKEFYRHSREDDRLDLTEMGIHVTGYEVKPVQEIDQFGDNTEAHLEETIQAYLGKDI